MRYIRLPLGIFAASVILTSLVGCNDDTTTVPTPATASAAVPFSVFATQAFANSANSTPVSLDTVVFTYDVNNDPTAFDELLL